MAIASINPVTGEVLKTFEPLTDQELEHKLALADRTFATYKHSSFSDRAQWMNQAADILEAKKQNSGLS